MVLGLGVCTGALAAEQYADGRLRQQFEYDTNIDLSEDSRSAFGSRSVVGLVLGTRTPAIDLKLDGEFRLVRFFGESDLNSNDALVNALGSWNWRRTALDLRAGFLRDTTRDLLDTDTGTAIDQNEERLTIDVESSIEHRFTPIQTGGLNLLYRKRIFPSLSSSDAEDLDLEEFSFYSADGSWSYALTPALALRTVVGTSYYDSDQEQSWSVQARGGANYAPTPALNIDGTIGPTVIDTDAKGPLGESGTTVGALWNLDVAYQPSGDAAFLTSFFQELNPQSRGGELDLRTGLELEFEYGITRRTSFSLPALVQRQDPVEGGGDTRYYARLEPTLGFLVAPHLRLETAYRVRWQTFDDGGGDNSDDATSHAVFVSLAFELPSLYTSR
jgi:hypothetical protein